MIIDNMSNADYHSHSEISKSDLDAINRSIAYWIHKKTSPRKETPEMRIGTAIHDFVLSPELKHFYTCEPEIKKDGSKWVMDGDVFKTKTEAQECFCEFNSGKTILSKEEYDNVLGAEKALQESKRFQAMIKGAETEVSVFSEIDGVGVRCRPDIFREDQILIDLKTSLYATPEYFRSALKDRRYYVQAAWYLDIVSKVTGIDYNTFIFVVIERAAPYGISFFDLGKESIEYGRKIYKQDLDRYKRYLDTKIVEGYSDQIQSIDLPSWARI